MGDRNLPSRPSPRLLVSSSPISHLPSPPHLINKDRSRDFSVAKIVAECNNAVGLLSGKF